MPPENQKEISERLDSELRMLMSHYAMIQDSQEYNMVSSQDVEALLCYHSDGPEGMPFNLPKLVEIKNIGINVNKDHVTSVVDASKRTHNQSINIPIQGHSSVLLLEPGILSYELAYFCSEYEHLLGVSVCTMNIPTAFNSVGEKCLTTCIELEVAYILPEFRGQGYSNTVVCGMLGYLYAPLEALFVFCARHGHKLSLILYADYENKGGERIGKLAGYELEYATEHLGERYGVSFDFDIDTGY